MFLVAGLWSVQSRVVRQSRLNRALTEAAIEGKTEKVRSLLLEGANSDARSEPYIKPIETVDVVAVLKGAFRHLLYPTDRMGPTVLIQATGHSHPAVVKALLEHGATVDARDRNGGTALMFAAMNGDLGTVNLLLEHGANANANATDAHGATPLMCAAAGDDKSIVQLSLDRRNWYQGGEGLQAKTIAALVRRGALVNARDTRGRTALMCASRPHHREELLALLVHGADPNARDEEGRSVWFYSLSYNSDIRELLKKAGGRP